MSNFLAFASVTATISYILEEVNKDVPGIKITARPLDTLDSQNPVNGLNILLHYVTPSPAVGSIDFLMKNSRGDVINNPSLTLDLHYLVTATASENNDIVAQQILASAMRILNEHPVLGREIIRNAVKNKEGLESSDLADQVENVELELEALSIDELTKIWSRFPNTNFRTSVAYTATVVLLESKIIQAPSIIRSIVFGQAAQLKSPIIDRIEPMVLEHSPNAKIMILGSNLKGTATTIEFDDGVIIQPKNDADLSDSKIVVNVPTNLRPGISRIKVIHKLGPEIDSVRSAEKRQALASNLLPFVLTPRIITPRQGKIIPGSEVIIEFEPPIPTNQDVIVLLGDREFPAILIKTSYAGEDSNISNKASFNISEDVLPGVYPLRLRMGSVESLLVIDENPRSPTFMKSIEPYLEVIPKH